MKKNKNEVVYNLVKLIMATKPSDWELDKTMKQNTIVNSFELHSVDKNSIIILRYFKPNKEFSLGVKQYDMYVDFIEHKDLINYLPNLKEFYASLVELEENKQMKLLEETIKKVEEYVGI